MSESDLAGACFQNDVIVRGFAAVVQDETWWALTKDRRTTAMASPFAAALYSDENTVLLLVLDLTDSSERQFKAVERALDHLRQHAQASLPKVLVGAKPNDPGRSISVVQAAGFARALGLPYVESDGFEGAKDLFALACLMATGHQVVYAPQQSRRGARFGGVRSEFLGDHLGELKRKAEAPQEAN